MRTQMIHFSYSSRSRTSTQDPEREDNLSPADAHDFEDGVYSRDYDNRIPLHIASPQGWIDVSGHLLIHSWIDMLLLPFMVLVSSSVSPIEDGSAKKETVWSFFAFENPTLGAEGS